MKEQRYVVYYRGRVQGVGFRYTVCRLVEGFEVKGFVRNLADGRVQVVAEGYKEELDNFLKAIEREMGSYIRGSQIDGQQASGEFTDFSLRW